MIFDLKKPDEMLTIKNFSKAVNENGFSRSYCEKCNSPLGVIKVEDIEHDKTYIAFLDADQKGKIYIFQSTDAILVNEEDLEFEFGDVSD
jgi:hypothetical protein